MKKSQIISLVALFVYLTVFVVLGMSSDTTGCKGDPVTDWYRIKTGIVILILLGAPAIFGIGIIFDDE